MTTWRIVTRAIYVAGGSATTEDLLRHVDTDRLTISNWLRDARNRGTVSSTPIPHSNYAMWRLTERGQAWCEGRAEYVRHGPVKQAAWKSTWLASLPRGIRLQAEQPQECQAA